MVATSEVVLDMKETIYVCSYCKKYIRNKDLLFAAAEPKNEAHLRIWHPYYLEGTKLRCGPVNIETFNNWNFVPLSEKI